MVSFIQKFKNLFTKPDVSDQDRIERWKTEVDAADRIKELHRQSRKQEKKDPLVKKKKLSVQDFEKAAQKKKKSNKTLSSNF